VGRKGGRRGVLEVFVPALQRAACGEASVESIGSKTTSYYVRRSHL
jgi:hypothetical protein